MKVMRRSIASAAILLAGLLSPGASAQQAPASSGNGYLGSLVGEQALALQALMNQRDQLQAALEHQRQAVEAKDKELAKAKADTEAKAGEAAAREKKLKDDLAAATNCVLLDR